MDLISILSMVLVFLIFLIIILIFVYLKLRAKEQSSTKKTVDSEVPTKTRVKSYKEYSKESIFKFMEFDKIQDNMIIQKNGKRFLMAIECQGINYDLMSEIEKNSVEMGFMKVLNTLRSPIQIYVQTRTINLEGIVEKYRQRLSNLQDELASKELKYKKMVESNKYTEQELRKYRLEIIRHENMCEYGKDIISNTERMSLNKNILRKKYYIILSYHATSTDNELLDKEEIKDAAFGDLYTKCQSLIRVLASTEVIGRVLNSTELVDLLYNSYNRDEAEAFGINKAQEAEYDDLYITAPDVLDKRMIALNKKIEEKALERAEESIVYANKRRELEEKEKSMDDLIDELAMSLIDENEQYLGKEVVQMAKEEVKNKRGGKTDGKKETTRSKK